MRGDGPAPSRSTMPVSAELTALARMRVIASAPELRGRHSSRRAPLLSGQTDELNAHLRREAA